MDSSPPPFIVFRSPRVERVDLYQLALDFTAAVAKVVDQAAVRFHLKDRLDRNATAIAMQVGQAASDPVPSERRKSYRKAHVLAVDCSTILDILARRADLDPTVVRAAQQQLGDLVSNLDQLARR